MLAPQPTLHCHPESVHYLSVQVRTTMNMMGPLMNPAGAVYGLIGTYSPAISQLMGEALQRLGSKKALVVHSQGLDELTPLGEADIVDVTPQRIKRYSLDPKELGIPRSATMSSSAVYVWLALQKQASTCCPVVVMARCGLKRTSPCLIDIQVL